MEFSLKVDAISKQYRIGQLFRENMLRDAVVNFVKHPFVKKSKETIWALKDVSFEIKKGETLGIIGRNGAGKSTLLKVLSKITYPSSGSLKVHGRIASLLEVGTGFHLELTGRENIYMNGSILGMKKKEIDKRIDEIIEFSGIGNFIDTPVKRYSSGMRLRLGFAVAAHLIADILLIDEILAVGDAGFQKKCLNAMGGLSSGGRTVLFVSHNMAAVENLCQRVIWIDDGKVKKDGDSKEVIRSYLETFSNGDYSNFDLDKIENRSGNGAIRFSGMEFLDLKGNPKNIIQTGDSLIVRLHYYSENGVRNLHFALELYTVLGTKVTSLNTWASGFEIQKLPWGEGYIDVEIDSLNIVANRYYVSLWAASAGNLWYDKLDYCAMLDVEQSDFYNSGREMSSQHFGMVLFPCKWKLNGR